ncbi:hypothetical protein ACO0LO_19505 [Undibacterium sp. TJN25]|uniref:hypothetical protein n=1 Tax=Undibacterium sp. TJN25 TaxID=3413056 RepID=UPI003BF34948
MAKDSQLVVDARLCVIPPNLKLNSRSHVMQHPRKVPMSFLTAFRHFFVVTLIFFNTAAMADVKDTPTERRLSIPGSVRGIVMPREDWTLTREQLRPGDTAVYYMFSSERRKLFFSVYIDKTNVCQSSDTCLETALKNSQYKDAKELQKSDDGQFKIAQFFIDHPQGTPINQTNLLASAYVDGQWFDIHISKVGKERPEFAPLLEFLQAVVVK